MKVSHFEDESGYNRAFGEVSTGVTDTSTLGPFDLPPSLLRFDRGFSVGRGTGYLPAGLSSDTLDYRQSVEGSLLIRVLSQKFKIYLTINSSSLLP